MSGRILLLLSATLQQAPLHPRVSAPVVQVPVGQYKGRHSFAVHTDFLQALQVADICNQIERTMSALGECLYHSSRGFVMSSNILFLHVFV